MKLTRTTKMRPTKPCQHCGKQTEKPRDFGAKSWAKKKFCSRLCSALSQKGRVGIPHTDAFKMAVSLRHKGKVNTAEAKQKMAKAKMGPQNPNWRGGKCTEVQLLRNRADYRAWRNAVLARDNYRCVECGIRQGWSRAEKRQVIIDADHIRPFAIFPELRFAIDNGRALCRECHKKTPTYGFRRKDLALDGSPVDMNDPDY